MKPTCQVATSMSLIFFSVLYTLRAGFIAHHTPAPGYIFKKTEFYKWNHNSLTNPHN